MSCGCHPHLGKVMNASAGDRWNRWSPGQRLASSAGDRWNRWEPLGWSSRWSSRGTPLPQWMLSRVSQWTSCLWGCHTRRYIRAITLRVRDLVRTFWRVPYRHLGDTRSARSAPRRLSLASGPETVLALCSGLSGIGCLRCPLDFRAVVLPEGRISPVQCRAFRVRSHRAV